MSVAEVVVGKVKRMAFVADPWHLRHDGLNALQDVVDFEVWVGELDSIQGR